MANRRQSTELRTLEPLIEQDNEGRSTENETSAGEPEIICYHPIPHDGGWGWAVTFGAFLIHVLADGFIYAFGVIAVELLKEFDKGRALTSWIVSVMIGLYLGIGPFAGAVTDRYGCRLTTMVGSVIASIGCAISCFATSVEFLMVSVGVIMGIGFGLMYCPAIVIVTMYFEKRRTFATGIAVCGAGVGTFLFAPLSKWLIDAYSWRGAFLIYAGIILNGVVCGALYRPIQFAPVYADTVDETKDDGQISKNGPTLETTAIENGIGQRIEMNGTIIPTVIVQNVDDVQAQPQQQQQQPPPQQQQQQPPPQQQQQQQQPPPQQQQQQPPPQQQQQQRRPRVGTVEDSRTITTSLLQVTPIKERSTSMHSLRRRTVTMGTGYLGIKDVFYPGSVAQIDDISAAETYRRTPATTFTNQHCHTESHHLFGSSHALEVKQSDLDLYVERPAVIDGKTGTAQHKFLSIIGKMVHIPLLTSPLFLVYALSNFLTSAGLNAPLILLPDKSNALGIQEEISSWFLSAYGISNTAGRLVFGYLCDRELPFKYGRNPARNRLLIYNTLITLCGVCTMMSYFYATPATLLLFAILFGFTFSAYICLTSVLLVDFIGMDNLTNGFGLLMLFQGVASLIGPPIAGWIVDATSSYDLAFVFCGVLIFISGIMLYSVPWIPPMKRRR